MGLCCWIPSPTGFPNGTISLSSGSGTEGIVLTIMARAFPRYSMVDAVEFGGREITPVPKPGTDPAGQAVFDVRIPGSDPGIHIIRVEVAGVVAAQPFTVVEDGGAGGGTVETILAGIIAHVALERVFRFDNATKEWRWNTGTRPSRTPTTCRLRFSEEPEDDFSYKTLRDHAFTVTGGQVTKTRRLAPPSNTGWEIHVTPNGNSAVTIVLPVTTDCTAQGAVCTQDRRPLSVRLEVTVPGPDAPVHRPLRRRRTAPAHRGAARPDHRPERP